MNAVDGAYQRKKSGLLSHSNRGFLISLSLHYESQNTRVSIKTKQKLPETHTSRFHDFQQRCRLYHPSYSSLSLSIAIPCLIAFPPGITTDRSGTQQSELTLLAGRMPSAILSCWPTSFSAHSKISPNVTPLSEDRLSQWRMLESS
jgi:hypothetical protein